MRPLAVRVLIACAHAAAKGLRKIAVDDLDVILFAGLQNLFAVKHGVAVALIQGRVRIGRQRIDFFVVQRLPAAGDAQDADLVELGAAGRADDVLSVPVLHDDLVAVVAVAVDPGVDAAAEALRECE